MVKVASFGFVALVAFADSKLLDKSPSTATTKCGHFLSSSPEDADIEISLEGLPIPTTDDVHFQWWVPEKSQFSNVAGVADAKLMKNVFNGGTAPVGIGGTTRMQLCWPAWDSSENHDENSLYIHLEMCSSKGQLWTDKLIYKQDSLRLESCDTDQSQITIREVKRLPETVVWKNPRNSTCQYVSLNAKSKSGMSKGMTVLVCIVVIVGLAVWAVMVLKEHHDSAYKPAPRLANMGMGGALLNKQRASPQGA